MKKKITIEAFQGIGDSIYQRPVIEQLFKYYDEIYLSTSWPELFWDFPEKYPIKFIRPHSLLRTQKKNEIRWAPQYSSRPLDVPTLKLSYGVAECRNGLSIIEAFAAKASVNLDNSDFDFTLPINPIWEENAEKIMKSLRHYNGQPIALVRPCVLRKEWMNSARNCKPSYINTVITQLKRTHYVIGFGDCVVGEEWPVGSYRFDDAFLDGEFHITDWIGLLPKVDILVSPVSFALPLGVATKTKTLIIYGGFQKPSTALDSRMDLSNFKFVAPNPFCNCLKNDHHCNKDIPRDKLLAALNNLLRGANCYIL